MIIPLYRLIRRYLQRRDVWFVTQGRALQRAEAQNRRLRAENARLHLELSERRQTEIAATVEACVALWDRPHTGGPVTPAEWDAALMEALIRGGDDPDDWDVVA